MRILSISIVLLAGMALSSLLSGCGSSDNAVVAKVGDEVITIDDFNNFISGIRNTYTSAQQEFESKSEFLDTMVVQRMFVQAAYEKNIDKVEEIARVVLQNRDKFLLESLYEEHIAAHVALEPGEMEDYYDHLEFQIRASHILVASEDTALALFERIKAGENFEQLAYDYSIDQSAKRNRGDLGFFTWGSMVDEFQNAVFQMETGEIAPPVKSQFGWHIIKLVEKQPNELREEFDLMKAQIERQILSRKQYQSTNDYYELIREKYPISLDTSVADYVTHKRLSLYPPQLLSNVPKNDFDEKQLDRNERELPLATWEGGQITLIEYILDSRRQIPAQIKPDFDDYDSLRIIIFEMKKTEILAYEASREGLENSETFKKQMKLFREYSMADMMRNDSLPKPAQPTDSELRQYYDANPDEFEVPATMRLYEIHVRDELLAQKLAKEIKSLETFKKKAAELTERAGKRQTQGDLGWIEEKWFPNLFPAAWKTSIGAIGGPVRSHSGYSVYYPIERRQQAFKDFLEAKSAIAANLYKARTDSSLNAWLDERRAIQDVETHHEKLWETIDRSAYAQVDSSTVNP